MSCSPGADQEFGAGSSVMAVVSVASVVPGVPDADVEDADVDADADEDADEDVDPVAA